MTRFTYLTWTKDGQGSRKTTVKRRRRPRPVVGITGFKSWHCHRMIVGKFLCFLVSKDATLSVLLSLCPCLSHTCHVSGFPVGMAALHGLM